MARKFCPDCSTLHDGRCSPSALAKAGKGPKAKKSNGGRDAKAVTAKAPAAHSARRATIGDEPEVGKASHSGSRTPGESVCVTGGESAAPEITKEQLVEALTVSLPKAEADQLRAFAAKLEANAKANRERVAAHKAGLSVADYRKQQGGGA